MDRVLEFLNSHVSVRQFTDRGISEEDELAIVTTAQRSPTSSNLHAHSIISVRDSEKKRQMAVWSGNQNHVEACPLFLVFCADLYRLERISKSKGYDFCGEYADVFIVATVDAALAAGRALLAAQALGMGGVMVGALRTHTQEVSAMLGLPRLVYPVMGMSLGYPAARADIKPRLPIEAMYFRETYSDAGFDEMTERYDDVIDKLGHLKGRELNAADYPDFKGRYSWSEHSARRMADRRKSALRPHLLEFLQRRGFLKK